MENNVINIRVFYHKLGRAKYISHLDITRCMQRALSKTRLPVWYTEGFNPHIYLTFALPLSLGYESLSESMDLRLTESVPFDEVLLRLNAALPADIRVQRVAIQVDKPLVIKSALYQITLKSDAHPPKLLFDCFENLVSQDKIEVVKRSKKGNKLIDIKPDIDVISLDLLPDCVIIKLKTTAGSEKNVNPTLLTDEMLGKYNLEHVQAMVIRLAVFDINGNNFQ